jgi:hypothetical protein
LAAFGSRLSWKTDASGQVVMPIKFGSKPVEFEKGKAGIVVGSRRGCRPSSTH